MLLSPEFGRCAVYEFHNKCSLYPWKCSIFVQKILVVDNKPASFKESVKKFVVTSIYIR